MAYERDIDLIRKKIYEECYVLEYNQYQDITDDRLEKLKNTAENTRTSFFKEHNVFSVNKNLDLYFMFVTRISTPEYRKMYSFDERMLLMILVTDPELSAYKIYQDSKIVSKSFINQTENENSKKYLIDKRSKQIKEFQSKVRDKIGYFDGNLITYEKDYYNKLLNKDSFVKGIKMDYSKILLSKVNEIDTSLFTPSVLDKVNEKVQEYISTVDNYDYKSVSYHLINQNKLIGLESIEEDLLFFLLAIDPELKVLQIYENSCNLKEIKPKIKQEFCFFNLDFIRLEKRYHDIYEPEKVMSLFLQQ